MTANQAAKIISHSIYLNKPTARVHKNFVYWLKERDGWIILRWCVIEEDHEETLRFSNDCEQLIENLDRSAWPLRNLSSLAEQAGRFSILIHNDEIVEAASLIAAVADDPDQAHASNLFSSGFIRSTEPGGATQRSIRALKVLD